MKQKFPFPVCLRVVLLVRSHFMLAVSRKRDGVIMVAVCRFAPSSHFILLIKFDIKDFQTFKPKLSSFSS